LGLQKSASQTESQLFTEDAKIRKKKCLGKMFPERESNDPEK
jgi:hypothetical protein